MNKEAAWVIVGDGSPYTYVGKADTSEIAAVESGDQDRLHLYNARQVQTVVIPTQNPLDPSKQMIGQENLVGPFSLCAADATMLVKVTKLTVADPETIKILRGVVGGKGDVGRDPLDQGYFMTGSRRLSERTARP